MPRIYEKYVPHFTQMKSKYMFTYNVTIIKINKAHKLCAFKIKK